eukprot:scaffold24509_cov127-Cylindrotheca_fusiformis.AAC.3
MVVTFGIPWSAHHATLQKKELPTLAYPSFVPSSHPSLEWNSLLTIFIAISFDFRRLLCLHWSLFATKQGGWMPQQNGTADVINDF